MVSLKFNEFKNENHTCVLEYRIDKEFILVNFYNEVVITISLLWPDRGYTTISVYSKK